MIPEGGPGTVAMLEFGGPQFYHRPGVASGRTGTNSRQMVRTLSNERRESIMEVAAGVFARKGYHQATVADIIEGASIARGTFYLYFKSKQEVFERLLDRFLDALKGGIRGIDLDCDEAPRAQLEANLERTIQTVCRYRDVAALVLGTLEAPDPRIRGKADRFFAEIKELVTSSIQTGQLMGLVRMVPPDVAVHFAFGAAREVMRDMVALRHGPEDAAETHRLATALVDLVASGLLDGEARLP